jgi:predicted alpha/beta-hydrolase family hydrolase
MNETRPGSFRVAISPAAEVTATAYPAVASPAAPAAHTAPAGAELALLLAHGAGAGQRHPYIVGTAKRLSERGISVVTFDFLYTERGKKLPDRNDALEACLRAVFDAVRAKTDGLLFAGGKSMGGRIASQVAAKGEIETAGLVFLGYPLHPPGKPREAPPGRSARGKREPRDKHLPGIRAPMLFVQGTRDSFGTAAEIAPLLPGLTRGSRLVPVEGGDHSHTVPKRGGTPQETVLASIADEIAAWMRARGDAIGRAGSPSRNDR